MRIRPNPIARLLVAAAVVCTSLYVLQTGPAAAAATPVVSVGDAAIAEGHTRTRTVSVPVTLDVPATTPQTVAYVIAGGTATAGAATQASTSADFKGVQGTLSFPANTVVKYLNVVVYGDVRAEPDETVTVTLSAPSSGLQPGDTHGTVTIRDDEATPGAVASIGVVSMLEGDSKTRAIKVPITLSNPAPGAVVRYQLVAFTATGGWSGSGTPPVGADFGDKQGAVQTVTFANTSVQQVATVVVVPELFDESDEVFSVAIVSVTGAAVGSNGVGWIGDDDRALVADPAFGPAAGLVGVPAPGSTLVGCAQSGTRVQVNASAHLDPSCSYTRGLDITASNVTLDCRGASVARGAANTDQQGIHIHAPTTVALSNITVRNCSVSGFLNNLRVSRDGFKDLVLGSEYVNAFSNIGVENSSFSGSQGSGIFVNGYVTGVTLSRLSITNNGGVGIYLEAGSKDNVVSENVVSGNGFADVIPGPASTTIGSTVVYFLSTGREGIAVDGSRNNLIRDNLITGNSAGGIFLYKNCGEDVGTAGHWVRPYGADGNVIRHNVIADEPNGVWVGSRAAENQYFMGCSDTPIVDSPGTLTRVYLDPADSNTIEYNLLDHVTNAIRLESDATTVRGNTFATATRGVLLGTKHRTAVLAEPIAGSVLRANTAIGVTDPYTWVWGKGTTTFSGNSSNGAAGKLLAGTQPTINPFLFVLSFVPAP